WVGISTSLPSPSYSRTCSGRGVFERSHGIFIRTTTACGGVGLPVSDQPAPSMWTLPGLGSATAGSQRTRGASTGAAISAEAACLPCCPTVSPPSAGRNPVDAGTGSDHATWEEWSLPVHHDQMLV